MSNAAIQSTTIPIPNEAGWLLKSIDDLCRLVSRGTAPVYVEHSDVLAINQRCIASSGFAPEFARPHSHRAMRNVLRPEAGDVLLNSTGTGTIGRSVVFNVEGTFIVDGHVTVLRTKPNLADGRWLNAVLHTFWGQNHLERYCYSGSTNQLELNRTPLKISQLPVPLPTEQGLIVKILDTLDTAIRETEAIIAKLKAVKQGLLHDLLTRGIAANGELRPPQADAPQLYKKSPLGWIPKEWDAVTLVSIADVQTGSTPLRAMGSRYFDARGFPWVKTLDLNEDVITNTDERITVAAVKESSCSLLPIGTVLVAMYGGWEQIGRVAMLNIEAATNQAISALRFKSQETVPEYVLRAIQHGRPRWKKVAASTRKDPNITKADVEAFQIAMSSHPTEQIEIAARYRALLEQLVNEQADLQKFRSLKAGLMDDLLTGRVRVTPLLDEEEAAHG